MKAGRAAEADAATAAGAEEVSMIAVEPARIDPAVLTERIAGRMILRFTDILPPVERVVL